jgi:hypothetical protein
MFGVIEFVTSIFSPSKQSSSSVKRKRSESQTTSDSYQLQPLFQSSSSSETTNTSSILDTPSRNPKRRKLDSYQQEYLMSSKTNLTESTQELLTCLKSTDEEDTKKIRGVNERRQQRISHRSIHFPKTTTMSRKQYTPTTKATVSKANQSSPAKSDTKSLELKLQQILEPSSQQIQQVDTAPRVFEKSIIEEDHLRQHDDELLGNNLEYMKPTRDKMQEKVDAVERLREMVQLFHLRSDVSNLKTVVFLIVFTHALIRWAKRNMHN